MTDITRVYYTGDVCNHPGWFTATERPDGNLTLTEEPGDLSFDREFIESPRHIGRQYDGTCNPRFVTADAHAAFKACRLALVRASVEGRAPHVAPPIPRAQERGAQLSQFVHDMLVASARLATIPTVDAVAALLVARDGAYVVSGHTFTDPASAKAARLLVAHAVRLDMVRGLSLVRALERASARRLWTEGERTCAWCHHAIRALDDAEELGLSLVHHPCAVEFGEWANDGKSDEQIAMEQREQRREQQWATLRALEAGEPVTVNDDDTF